jgi:hypothetical protein
MAIQPIDLQTMYTSLEKLSKNVAFQQQGLPLQNSITEDVKTRKNGEERKTVQKTEEQKNTEIVKDRKEHDNSESESSSKKEKPKENKKIEEEITEYEEIKDPSLGQHIDISG